MKEAKKKVFWALFSLLLAGLSIWAVMSQSKTMSILKLWKSLRDADLKWIFAAVLCMLGFIYFEGAALLVIVRAAGYRQNQFSGLVYSASDIYFFGYYTFRLRRTAGKCIFHDEGRNPRGSNNSGTYS